jgi:hypothetical protein
MPLLQLELAALHVPQLFWPLQNHCAGPHGAGFCGQQFSHEPGYSQPCPSGHVPQLALTQNGDAPHVSVGQHSTHCPFELQPCPALEHVPQLTPAHHGLVPH